MFKQSMKYDCRNTVEKFLLLLNTKSALVLLHFISLSLSFNQLRRKCAFRLVDGFRGVRRWDKEKKKLIHFIKSIKYII